MRNKGNVTSIEKHILKRDVIEALVEDHPHLAPEWAALIEVGVLALHWADAAREQVQTLTDPFERGDDSDKFGPHLYENPGCIYGVDATEHELRFELLGVASMLQHGGILPGAAFDIDDFRAKTVGRFEKRDKPPADA
jgi:hypothetical protein